MAKRNNLRSWALAFNVTSYVSLCSAVFSFCADGQTYTHTDRLTDTRGRHDTTGPTAWLARSTVIMQIFTKLIKAAHATKR